MAESDSLMTVKEVAAFLNVAEVTVRRMTARGDLPCYRVGNRHERRFRLRDLEVYLERRREPSHAGATPGLRRKKAKR
jgi:transcriptional repressor of dcmA and dcmR